MFKILVLDIETSSLYPNDGVILEIGACVLDVMTGLIEEKFNKIIKESEDFDKDAWIFNNSDLTPEMIIEKGVSIESIRNELQSLLDKYPSVAYNQSFDFGWLKSRDFNVGYDLPDPMEIATDLLQIERWDGSYKWPKVTECMDYFSMDGIEPHRALEDSKIEAEIIYKLIEFEEYEIEWAKITAKTPELKLLRYDSKIKAYQYLMSKISDMNDLEEISSYIEKEIAFLKPKNDSIESKLEVYSIGESYEHILKEIEDYETKQGFINRLAEKVFHCEDCRSKVVA